MQYSMKYDLDINGGMCKGQLICRDGAIEAVEDDAAIFSIPISEVKDLKLT